MTTKRSIHALLLVLVIAAGIFAVAVPRGNERQPGLDVETTGIENSYSYQFSLSVGYFAYTEHQFSEDRYVYGEVSSTTTWIVFMILDSSSMSGFRSGGAYSPLYKVSVFPPKSYNITLPRGTWYLVWWNDRYKKTTVTATMYAQEFPKPTISHNLVDGGTYNGSLAITASANDSAGIYSTSISIDGTVVSSSYQSTIAYTWVAQPEQAGKRSIKIQAENQHHGISYIYVNYNVPDTWAPQVTWVDEIDVVSGTHEFTFVPSDNVAIKRLAVYVNDTLAREFSSPTSGRKLTFSWNTNDVINGSAEIMVIAWDAAGNNCTRTFHVEIDNFASWVNTQVNTVLIVVIIVGGIAVLIAIIFRYKCRHNQAHVRTIEVLYRKP